MDICEKDLYILRNNYNIRNGVKYIKSKIRKITKKVKKIFKRGYFLNKKNKNENSTIPQKDNVKVEICVIFF